MEYQRAPKNKPTGLHLCGLSGHLGSPNTLSSDEHQHELNETFVTMTEEAIVFWLPKFIAEAEEVRSDRNLNPPNSVYQICCGLSRVLMSAIRSEIDIFNSP